MTRTKIATVVEAWPPEAPQLKPRVNFNKVLNRYLGPANAYHSNLVLFQKQHGLNPFDAKVAAKVRPRALARYRDIPPVARLEVLAADFWSAATVPAAEPIARVLIGGMLDALRSKPTDGTPIYVDMLVAMLCDEIGDFDRQEYVPICVSPTVMAWAVRRIIKEEKFPPDIADFLGACRQLQWKFREAAMAVERLIELRNNAEDILRLTGDVADDGTETPF